MDLLTGWGTVNLSWEGNAILTTIISVLRLTVSPGRLSPDMVAPGTGVFPQISVRRRQIGLGLPHGEVGGLPSAALLHHLVVVLGLEPDHQYIIIIKTTLREGVI